MNTVEIRIIANEEQQEILISKLIDLDSCGFEQTETHLIAYFPMPDFNVNKVTEIIKSYNYVSSIISEKNWNEEWEKNFDPVIVNDFCRIRAHFHEPDAHIKHELIITPKMSFGTGHHSTTYMMIEQMKELDFNNKKILDFGTGTGILSILAEKMGASEIIAIDLDEWSINNAKENAQINGCKRIKFELTSKIPITNFDIVLANINRNVIIENFQTLINCLNKSGLLLLSGLMEADEAIILETSRQYNLKLSKQKAKNGWIMLLLCCK